MKGIEWIKLATIMCEDEKMRLIDSMEYKDPAFYLWIRLLLQAGKVNDNGLIYLKEDVPYTNEMLSILFSRSVEIIEKVFKIFEAFKMIEIYENNVIKICNWEKHQNIEGMKRVKEGNKERVKNFRERKKKENGFVENIISKDYEVIETAENLSSKDYEVIEAAENENNNATNKSDHKNCNRNVTLKKEKREKEKKNKNTDKEERVEKTQETREALNNTFDIREALSNTLETQKAINNTFEIKKDVDNNLELQKSSNNTLVIDENLRHTKKDKEILRNNNKICESEINSKDKDFNGQALNIIKSLEEARVSIKGLTLNTLRNTLFMHKEYYVKLALEEAIERKKFDMNYISGILKNWLKEGYPKTYENMDLKNSKDKTLVSKKEKNNLRFNNFEPRKYDYEELERKLLGW